MKAEANCSVKQQTPEAGEPLEGFIRGLRDTHGLDLAAYDEVFLGQAIARQAQAGGLGNAAAHAAWLLENRVAAEAFCQSLHISHSEFFRDPLTFALLEQRILPGLIAEKQRAGRREIRVWSAGCAAGQEAWSIAILLDALTRAANPPQAYRIFASDLSEPELAVARAGVYGAAAVANVRLRHLDGFFSRHGDTYQIASCLRARVDFCVHDLLDPSTSSPEASIYGDFDLILCCNLLFYYRPGIQQQILGKLWRALAPGGYCVTGEAERGIAASQHGLRAVLPQAPVFQKVPVPDHGGFHDGLLHKPLTPHPESLSSA